MSEYEEGQLAAGFRSMVLLAALVERGGRPAPVAPTVDLRLGEHEYGWFPVESTGVARRLAVITNQRLIVGSDEYALRSIVQLEPDPAAWTLGVRLRGRAFPLVLRGPWVPWLGVVICSELYGTAFPPPGRSGVTLPAQRRWRSVDPDLGLQRDGVV
ncbi:hypothetical protein [Actinoplanes sp. NPDC051851]|uniref:hypothetical protein n=1 Tax=Actinoplanes sp. NPDC051851 TaxID=3154753 RepID=UPI0034371A99